MIETPRLVIVPFGEEHMTERYVSWLNDSEVVRHSRQRERVHTLESCREYLASFEGTPNRFWALVARDEQLGHIGNANAYVDGRSADVGILIGERGAWGHGYGSEAFAAICRHLLEEDGLDEVTAGTLPENGGMVAVMRKAGMQVERVRREDGTELVRGRLTRSSSARGAPITGL